MARKPKPDNREIILARLFLDIAREVGASLLQAEKYGSCADEIILTAAIYVGQHEGCPMTATKLADYSGIPRPTVVRKLEALRKRGVVRKNEGHAYLTTEAMQTEAFQAAMKSAAMQVVQAAYALSKMDS